MNEHALQQMALSELVADERQPREGVGDHEALEALKASMDQLGRTVQYVTVTRRTDGAYRIVSGHRRVQAARELGWEWLPVIVVDDVADDTDRRLRQIAENNARSPLKPIELCEAINELRAHVEPARIAGTTGVSLRTVYNYLTILEHPDLVEALRAGRPLRTVLADAAGRKRAGPAPKEEQTSQEQRKARRSAQRRATRSIERLREAWPILDAKHRQALGEALRSLLAQEDPQVATMLTAPKEREEPSPPPIATLH